MVVALLLLGMGVWWVLARRAAERERHSRAWHRAAIAADFAPVGSWPELAMAGRVGRTPVEFRQAYEGVKIKNPRCVAYAALPIGVGDLSVVAREGIAAQADAVAAASIDTGDPVFDRAFIVRAADPDLARRVLHDRARAAMLAARETQGAISIVQGQLMWTDRRFLEAEPAIRRLEALAACAEAFR